MSIGITNSGTPLASISTAASGSQMSGVTRLSSASSANAAATTAAPTGPVTAAQALRYLGSTVSGQVRIADSAMNIQRAWTSLAAVASRLDGVAVANANAKIAVTAAQFNAGSMLVSRLETDQVLEVSGTVSQLGPIGSSAKVRSLQVVDTAVNVQNGLGTLQRHAEKVGSIRFLGSATRITVGAEDFLQTHAALANAMPRNAWIDITGAKVSEVGVLAQDKRVRSIDVMDTVANIERGLDTLGRHSKLIDQVDDGNAVRDALNLDAEQLKQNRQVLGKVVRGYDLVLNGTLADWRAAGRSSSMIAGVKIHDTAENVSRGLQFLQSMGNKLQTIELSNSESVITTTSAALRGPQAAVLGKITSPYSLQFTNALTAQDYLTSWAAIPSPPFGSIPWRIENAQIVDTAANLNAAMADLRSFAHLRDGIASIRAQDGGVVQVPYSDVDFNLKFASGTAFAFGEMSASELVQASERYLVRNAAVRDTAANVQAVFDDLVRLQDRIGEVQVTDARDTVIRLNSSQILGSAELVKKMTGRYTIVSTNEAPLVRDGNFSDAGVRGWGYNWSMDTGSEGGISVNPIRNDSGTSVHVYDSSYGYGDNWATVSQPIGVLDTGAGGSRPRYLMTFETDSSANYSDRGQIIRFGVTDGDPGVDPLTILSAERRNVDAGPMRHSLEFTVAPAMQGDNLSLFITKDLDGREGEALAIRNVSLLRVG